MRHDLECLTFHDYFSIRGGGERLVLDLCKGLPSALAYGYRTAQTYDDEMFPATVFDLDIPGVFRKSGVRTAALALKFAASRKLASRYQRRIFSGVTTPFAAPLADNGRNVYYCHTPPRFLYDKREFFTPKSQEKVLRRMALQAFQTRYERAVDRMDTIVANSNTVRQRIKEFLGRDSTVVFPPCRVSEYAFEESEGYYLSTARLAPLKRVDLIVDAFLGMPDKRLVVTSGGDALLALKERAGDAKNIVFTGWVDEATRKKLLSRAIATIYLPRDEDFGMSPVESMASGKPVIGVAEGGLLETVLPGETGTLLPPEFSVAQLREAVITMSPQRAVSMRAACVARAEVFSEARFLSGMRDIVLA